MNDDYSLAMNIKEDIEECITRRDNSFPCISSFLLKPSVRKIVGELSGEIRTGPLEQGQKGT
ncbi:MAG: hypothetical protein ABRQ38_27355, partial [Candidatus Eremiobacterota bacterium]